MSRAPLILLPIILEPFSQIAMDIVGPLPRTLLSSIVICDYATRYREAIPLHSIYAEHILTDQGSNFTSQLLAKLYQLLHVHPIRTSPYHPQSDGLVERFNKTLNEMIRKTVTDGGKDWDRMIPYISCLHIEKCHNPRRGFLHLNTLWSRCKRILDVLKETCMGGRSKK